MSENVSFGFCASGYYARQRPHVFRVSLPCAIGTAISEAKEKEEKGGGVGLANSPTRNQSGDIRRFRGSDLKKRNKAGALCDGGMADGLALVCLRGAFNELPEGGDKKGDQSASSASSPGPAAPAPRVGVGALDKEGLDAPTAPSPAHRVRLTSSLD